MTESPFVRSGAVVRCVSCENKYRIKSAYIERVLTTGPRTLDEADTVLRSDSVDIDPDEIAPVKIDDEGNVVGLSGLSELMRQSDARGAQAKLQARADHAEATDVSVPSAVTPQGVATATSDVSPGRPRSRVRRRKKKTNLLVVAALVCLLVVSGVVLVMLTQGNGDTPGDDAPAHGNGNSPAGQNPDSNPDGGPTPVNPDGTTPNGTDDPVPVELFADVGPPSPNPDPLYQAPAPAIDPDVMPLDVPTVLTPSTRIEHEGWYVTSPPRGSADAVGVTDLELSEWTPVPVDADRTRLVASIKNRSSRVVLNGELHVMLLDSAARVFAETYMPLVMIGPNDEQQVSLLIATRHWQRVRGVRAGVSSASWADTVSPMKDVVIDAVGSGAQAALRISAQNTSDQALRNVLIIIEAADSTGGLLARFMVQNENLYVRPGGWLDLVVQTPLDDQRQAVRWSVIVQPR